MAQHLSIRIPWKDNGYEGLVCNKPCHNNACLRLRNIAENRNDALEINLAGCPMSGHEEELPCISEGGVFMSSKSHEKMVEHPYARNNSRTHGHFRKTKLVYPPFSLPARPFGWTMLNKDGNDNINHLAEMHNIPYDQSREPALGFETNWVQDEKNQRAIFERFYQKVEPRKSLVVPYAKQVPFIEDAKRVVMGVGFVENITLPPEYEHTDEGKLRSMLWETMIGHSIRNERKDGFLLPYREMMEYAEEHPNFDMRTITVFAEDNFFNEFSYATERLSYDALISVLLQTIKVLGIIKQCIPGNWDECIVWATERLAEVREDRGSFPGAGIMLYSMGFTNGISIAEETKDRLNEEDNFITMLEQAIAKPNKYLSQNIADSIGNTERTAFITLDDNRKILFWLLSRFSLTFTQASILFNHGYSCVCSGKKQYNNIDIGCSDAEIIKNPYIVFEKTRLLKTEFQVSLRCVDMAVFSQKKQFQHPRLKTSIVSNANDERRVRAVAVSILEQETDNGHTIYPQNKLIGDINELPLISCCSVSADILNGLKDYFSPEIIPVEMQKDGTAYQLVRIRQFDDVIRQSISKRVDSVNRHKIAEDWSKIVNEAFEAKKSLEAIADNNEREREIKARQEKIVALKELAEARLSVLIGGAGTGKTTLLALLCKSPYIYNGGVLLLAPTGKARVRMSQAMQQQAIICDAKTVAQFLLQNGRFDFDAMRYILSNKNVDDVPDTVIIDESSMLTEEMFGALVQALKKARRVIFAGDPKQLPPIGAGRPFVDLVNHLRKNIPAFPRVGKSFVELTITRRQSQSDGVERSDSVLAEWYSDANAEQDNEIFAKLQAGLCGENLSYRQWETPEELEKLIIETVAGEINMNGIDDINEFDRSLGGTVTNEATYFNAGSTKAEGWQILSPIRNQPYGVLNINYLFHNKYRNKFIELARRHASKLIPEPMGAERIVYGDKVINLINKNRYGYFWDEKVNRKGYVANGEIGVAVAGYKGKLQVEFSTQSRVSYQYKFGGDDAEIPLELAYALTIHKSQGSEFGVVILVIAEPCSMLSRELLYTAITRQKNRLVILCNSNAHHLRKYCSMEFSDIARRFTNLFEKPEIIEYKRNFYEAGLIHKTARGELVRSKSEVIIADALFDKKIDYVYEKELTLGEDGIKIPDFTIEDTEGGRTFYWEHCGMLSNNTYRRRWEAKLKIYEKHGIIDGENLIVSYDQDNGSIDSQEIRRRIECRLLQ